MKKLLLFDVDGTLTPARKVIKIKNLFQTISRNTNFLKPSGNEATLG